MNDLLSTIISQAEKANPQAAGDFVNADGLLCCGVCGTPKQTRITLPKSMGGGEALAHCMCECAKAQAAAEREAIRQGERENYRRDVFGGGNAMFHSFGRDDGKNSRLSKICHAYADKLPDFGKWLLLYGGTGVGKSYMAAAVANVAIDKDLTVAFTSVSEIERKLWSASDKSVIYDRLSHVDLLILDDFGAERDSSYIYEISFNVIDSRLRSGKPAVITTNLSQQELFKPADMAARRVLSRLWERSIPILCEGEDRRLSGMKETAGAALRELINLENGNE